MPIRVQIQRTKGWRMPPGAVKVDRSTKWGNPFNFKSSDHCWTALAFGCKAHPAGREEASVRAFRRWIEPNPNGRLVSEEFQVGWGSPDDKEILVGSPRVSVGAPPTLDEVREGLRGRDLACWCKPGTPCHADVLLELANGAGP